MGNCCIIHISFSNPYSRPNRHNDRNRKGGRGGGNGDNGGHRSHGSRGGGLGGFGGADGNRKNWFKMTVSAFDYNYKLSSCTSKDNVFMI